MTVVQSKIEINTSKDKVWAIIADLGGIVRYHPFITKSYYTSVQTEDVGASRYCYILPHLEVNEKALSWDPGESYTVKVDFTGGQPPPVEQMETTMSVSGDAKACAASVKMRYRFTGDAPMEEELCGQF